MTVIVQAPHMSVHGEEDREARSRRLLQAYDAMNAMVRILWPGDGTHRDPNAVQWRSGLVSLHEAEGRLYVTWRDEDHWDKFGRVVELAWTACGLEGGPVVHENADENGLSLPQNEPLY
jgi:hypothetical protein